MSDLATEKDHLAKAERDVAEGEERIARQAELVERLQAAGQDAVQAETLLRNLHDTLRTWRNHRDEILHTIERLEGRAGA